MSCLFVSLQAKKFVESAPQVVKADVGKSEAEDIKKQLEEAGATCEIEWPLTSSSSQIASLSYVHPLTTKV